MNQKEFIQKTEEIVNNMNIEELRNCISSITRKMPEGKRVGFLELLDDCYNKNTSKDSEIIYQFKKMMSDEIVKDKLTNIRKVLTEIENGELCLYAQGYEDYSNGYWGSDWIWVYEDKEGIGKIIEDAIIFAHNCMNDCRYEEALLVFKLVMDIEISVEDEHGGDSFELSLEELVDEEITEINLKTLSLEVLYTNYQLHPLKERANALYSYFTYSYFMGIHIEEIFSIGREHLSDTDMFFELWIDFLMQQSGDIAGRLLIEGILYHKGALGLVGMARQGYKEHPSIYLSALLEYEKTRDYKEMKEIGNEALEKLDKNLKIRGEIALKSAQASWCVNDYEFMKKCWYEAFYSNSTIPNYLRLFVDNDVIMEYKESAEKRLEELIVHGHIYNQDNTEIAKNNISNQEYKYLCFFTGKFDRVQNWCMEQKNPLGWSGHFIGDGINLMLLYLYANNDLKKAGKNLLARISLRMGFSESKNLVFINKNDIFKNEVSVNKRDEIFWGIFSLWKVNYKITAGEISKYIDWLEAVIDARINGIVGGKHRRKYNDVALLAAVLGEVKESLGVKMAKNTVISKYMGKYPRHSAFRSELKEYLEQRFK